MIESIQPLAYAPSYFLAVAVLVATACDVASRRIPNPLIASSLGCALLLAVVLGGINGFLTSLMGLGVGMAVLLPLYALRVTGAGDVKLLGVVGAFLGPHGALAAGVWTFFAGAVLGVIWLLWQSVRPMLVTYLHLDSLTNVMSTHFPDGRIGESGRSGIPYAPAIASGALIAAWQQGWIAPTIIG